MKTTFKSFLISGLVFLSTILVFQGCDDPNDDPIDYKPNIYIYPTENIQLDVNITFPLGGKILTSIPKYSKGWSVNIDANGVIDNKYTYLFYESQQPDIWQKKEGWIISGTDLEKFFKTNLAEYGFRGEEITDFTEHWVPQLHKRKTYLIYPQETELINRAIQLNFSQKPDYLFRLHYYIKERSRNDDIPQEPKVENKCHRDGFYITEWGVIMK